MKGFNRKNQLFSLCGLNCGLCPMQIGGYCPGCGGGAGNQSCKIAGCSLEHSGIEYCFDCIEYPCEKYASLDSYDSFITHKRRRADAEKAKKIGIEAYNREQKEKAGILNTLLCGYNDGRKKSFYCTAVNLLELSELREALEYITKSTRSCELSVKEKSAFATNVLRSIADKRNIELKLNKKK